MELYEYDKAVREKFFCIAGVDEAGRGPLAGDVYAAAVIFNPDTVIDGINDSKKISPKKREKLYDEIISKASAYCIATATVNEIEEINILNASMLAMKRAVNGLGVTPDIALIDGNKMPSLDCKSIAIVKGDATSQSIAAASILAKVARDRYMETMDEKYPCYQFGRHKGYGTKLHYEMIDKFGMCDIHRPSFLKKYVVKKNDNT